MPGGGKSAVISPLICILVNNLFKFNFIFLTLKQLVKNNYYNNFIQYNILFTKDIKYNENYNLTKKDFEYNNIIISDSDLKYYLYKNIYKYNDKTILLIDEIDSIFDPIKTEFNIVDKTNNLDNIKLNNVINYIFNYKNIKPYNDFVKELNEIINKDFNISNYNVELILSYNIYLDYMFSNINKFKIVPVEYTNKPLEGSKFNNIYDEIILTIFAFYEYKNNIRKVDIDNFNNIYKQIKYEFIKEKNDIDYNFKYKESININEYKKYIEYIIKNNLSITEEYYNYNTLDIINNQLILYKSGFSGTPDLVYYLPIINDYNIENNKLISKFEYKNIIDNIDIKNNTIKEHDNVIIQDLEGDKILDDIFNRIKDENIKYIDDFSKDINDYDNILNYIKDKKINCLIDTFGFFKNKLSEEIINDIFKFNLFENYIFIDNYDNIIYKDKFNINNIYSNELNFDENICFSYFDHKNIIGTNIKLNYNKDKIYNLLLLINDRTNLDLFYQSFYRDRNINNLNHNIHIIYLHNKDYVDNFIKDENNYILSYINNYAIKTYKYISSFLYTPNPNPSTEENLENKKLNIFLNKIKNNKNNNKQLISLIQNIRTNINFINNIFPQDKIKHLININNDIILNNGLLNNDYINFLIEHIKINTSYKQQIINILNYIKKNYHIINKKNIVIEKQKEIEKTIEKEKIISNIISNNSNTNLNYIFTFNHNSIIFYNLLDIFNIKLYYLMSLYIFKFKYYFNKFIDLINNHKLTLNYQNVKKFEDLSKNEKDLNNIIYNNLFKHNCIYIIKKNKNDLLLDLNFDLNNITNITLLFNILNISIFKNIKPNYNIINKICKIFDNVYSNFNFDNTTLISLFNNKNFSYYNIIKINDFDNNIKDNYNIYYYSYRLKYNDNIEDITNKDINEEFNQILTKNIIKNSNIFDKNNIHHFIDDIDDVKNDKIRILNEYNSIFNTIDYLVINDLENDFKNLSKNNFIVKLSKYNLSQGQFVKYNLLQGQNNTFDLINDYNPNNSSKFINIDYNIYEYISTKLNYSNSIFGGNNYNYYLKYLNLKQLYLNKKKKKF